MRTVKMRWTLFLYLTIKQVEKYFQINKFTAYVSKGYIYTHMYSIWTLQGYLYTCITLQVNDIYKHVHRE